MPPELIAVWILIAYLAGSIPFGLIIGLCLGVDIRTRGSGNIGATNLGRTVGRSWGILCFVLDLLKGLGPVLAYALWVRPTATAGWPEMLGWLVVAVVAVLGHVFPVWLKFKGGKGVATGLGVVLGIWPWLTLAGAVAGVLWAVITYRTGYVSLGSVVAALSVPVVVGIAVVLAAEPAVPATVYLTLALLIAALVVLRHRGNLKRLREGTEGRVAWSLPGRADA
ncbi:MAG: glycerol-3-phosphate 1-O-acyltransferase PlsY [Planctomycetota bacterium]